MSNPAYALQFTRSSQESAEKFVGRLAARRVWGVLCGAAFVAVRASVYLVVLPLVALACLAGISLYALQGVMGHHG